MSGMLNRVLASRRCLELYTRLRAVKWVGSAAHWAAGMVFPADRARWVQVARGPGRGLALLVYPRYDLEYVRGDHEFWMQDQLSLWLSQGDVFFDVGAHLGFFSLVAARLVGSKGAVFAFEPDPDNFARLQANIARNGTHWVSSHPVAVSDRRGPAPFAPNSAAGSRMQGRVLAEEPATAADILTVQAVILDDHYDGRSGVVKVDVEGGELLVLKGAPRLLAEGSLRWLVEAHSDELESAVVKVFKEAGYECRTVSRLRTPSVPEASGRYVIAGRGPRTKSRPSEPEAKTL